MLKVKNLEKHFGGVKAVNNCSFEIKEGLITALIGPNGSGKTTIFNIISRVVEKDSGAVFFKDKDISKYSMEKISNLGISRMFQRSQLFDNLSIEDNLLLAIDKNDTKVLNNILGLNKDSDNKKKLVDEVLDLIELKRFRKKIGSELSYGQKRLVEIARTILNPHELLMLDEPVAGVNPKLRSRISKIFKKMKKDKKTILLIEHDMGFVFNLADKIIVLNEGSVLIEGTPEKIRKNRKVLDIYLGN